MRTGTLTKELQHLCDHWPINLALKVPELVCGANNEISDLAIYILVSYAQLHHHYYYYYYKLHYAMPFSSTYTNLALPLSVALP